MTKIDPSYFIQNQQRSEPSSELGKDEFLKLLMAQIQNQDPLDPMDDREFISQMTTFSSLEQMMNMNESIQGLVENQKMSPVVQYSHLIGKEVSYYKLDEETGEVMQPQEIETSEVVAISEKEGYAVIELENDQSIYTDEIVRINNGEQG
ncbi:flagellar basal-body rod modification protein FlgD [Pelagirhabdus alkalitolerans]|uniref:Flagellar basal-body rod modification protein FlgD n=1 Tax=Pelagirhabdus alkalitolerans TaxID=1612202 RepID=A0A1G6H3F1_9BACI|nr:flagellar hook assembly protein FlgD [Pelagirhabdus alkalitolerans]SDB88683.1 flagellar basal-body rod modification protein FlgD [Pelagirhabdus alkalitolerans]